MKTIWIIVKDGAIAFGFWLVASVLLIYFLGYPGRMASLFLGLIFIVSFIGVTLKRLVNLATGSRSGGAPSGVAIGAPEDAPGWKTCTSCGGSGRLTCSSCAGAGSWYLGGQQQVCSGCGGARSLNCMNCSGSGRRYR